MSTHRVRFERRSRVVLAFFGLGFVIVVARAANLQIVRHSELSTLASGQYLNDIKIPARRGDIYDRHGKALAISVDSPSIFANPMEITDARQSARTLASTLGLDLDTTYRRLSSTRRFVWLKRQATPDEGKAVRALGIRGVGMSSESRRYYPNREVGGHVVGFAGVDSKGLEGVERSLDAALAGEPQVVETLRDARGKAVLAGALDPEHQAVGSDAYLTLDLSIQHAAEEALAKGVSEARARSGIAVVLDVPTAEVLAMAVEPNFNPNEPGKAKPGERRNRAITDMFEPASTFKPLVVAAALDSGAVALDDKVFCENGAFTITGHTIRDLHRAGWMDLRGIIQKSSNIGAAKVAQAIGRAPLERYVRAYGFGEKAGIAFPGEIRGMVRDSASWSEVGLATIGFGHGVAVNGLQLAAAYRVLAADGVYRAPSLVKRIDHPDSRRRQTTDVVERRVLRPGIAGQVIAMMEAAVSQGGTGVRAQVPGFRVAGKTGTAQKIDPVAGGYSADRFVAVFAGLLPVEDPRLVIVVAIDEPQGAHLGGQVAAPIFAAIGEAAARHTGLVPSRSNVNAALLRARALAEAVARTEPQDSGPTGLAQADDPGGPAVVRGRGDPAVVPSFIGLTARQALERYRSVAGRLAIEVVGSGRVVEQDPRPGLPYGELGTERLRLTLKDS